MVKQGETNDQVLKELLKNECFGRISGHASGTPYTDSLNGLQVAFKNLTLKTRHPAVFKAWASRLWNHHNDCLEGLLKHDTTLRRNWDNSPWAAATINFGPQTVCHRHTDCANLAYGWCAITALGDYDHKKGGHLVLWDLKLVIEFPPGSTIIIPSCAITHSNVRIQAGEHRYSFTQYTAGGLFRWIDNGFKPKEARLAALKEEEMVIFYEELSKQLEAGLKLYSTLDELHSL